MRSIWIATIALAAIGFATSAEPQQAKEGTFKGAYYGYGTTKATQVGDDIFMAGEEDGLQLTDWFQDHTTLHCQELTEVANGSEETHGHCVGVDPAGDKFAFDFKTEKHPPNQKSFKGTSTMATGTGKYRGGTGSSEFVVHANEFRPLAEGTFVNYVTFEGHYKLP
jgi:hypothetical protein